MRFEWESQFESKPHAHAFNPTDPTNSMDLIDYFFLRALRREPCIENIINFRLFTHFSALLAR
jgi:hypothetical protein